MTTETLAPPSQIQPVSLPARDPRAADPVNIRDLQVSLSGNGPDATLMLAVEHIFGGPTLIEFNQAWASELMLRLGRAMATLTHRHR